MARPASEKVDIFMPLFVADYLADTTDLTAEEHGAYLLLLMTSWRHGGVLENNPQRLARAARVPVDRWPNVWEAIGRFFDVAGNAVTQGRLVEELVRAQGRKAAASENGARGAAARWGGHSQAISPPMATPIAEGMAKNASSPSPSPSPSDPDPDPEHSLPRDPTVLVQGGPVTGPLLTLLFGRERAKLYPEALEWAGTPTSPEKAANMAATIPPSAIGTVSITMAMLLARAKAGTHRKSAEIVKAPGFGFMCWCAEYHELLEEISGKAPRAPPANGPNDGHRRNGRNTDPRIGHVRAEDYTHTKTGREDL